MYVDPELLEHLEEEQKLLLFIKMREEQIRRWKANEEKNLRDESLNGNRQPRKDNKRVQWRNGNDGEVWVWVMGEHPSDLTIDEILENEAKDKARQLAENEILMESMRMDSSVNENLDESKLKDQLMEINLYPNQNFAHGKNARYLPSEDSNNMDTFCVNNPPPHILQSRELLPVNIRSAADINRLSNNFSPNPSSGARLSLGDMPNLQQSYSQQPQHFLLKSQPGGSVENVKSPPIPQRPSNCCRNGGFSDGSPNEDFVKFTRSYVPGNVPMSNVPTSTSSSQHANNYSASLPFPVGGSSFVHSALPSPIASTTVFASTPTEKKILPITTSNNGNFSQNIVPKNETSNATKSSKLGFNIGGGRVSRIAARLSGGGKTATFKVPQSQNSQSSSKLTEFASFNNSVSQPAKIKFITAASYGTNDGDNKKDNEMHSLTNPPLVRRAYSAPRIISPEMDVNQKKDNNAISSTANTTLKYDGAGGGDYDNHHGLSESANVIKNSEDLTFGRVIGRNEINITRMVEEDPIMRLRSMLRDQQPVIPSSFHSLQQLQNAAPYQSEMMPIIQQPQIELGFKLRPQIGGTGSNSRMLSVDDENELEKRQSKIYEQILEQRDKMEREAEIEQKKERQAWEEQERKAREAEAQIRLITQKARQQHFKSLRTSLSLLPVLNDSSCTSLKDAIKNLPRPPKPKSRAAIVQWYKEVELPNLTGFDQLSRKPAFWFHGIISRPNSEELLTDKLPGSYLVRVSERIWGYTVSYVGNEGVTKHFLVEKIPEGYQFLGTNQIVHRTLNDLVLHHESAPITPKGHEILLHPIGQQNISTPDYADLIVS